jgi:hypothetical protein
VSIDVGLESADDDEALVDGIDVPGDGIEVPLSGFDVSPLETGDVPGGVLVVEDADGPSGDVGPFDGVRSELSVVGEIDPSVLVVRPSVLPCAGASAPLSERLSAPQARTLIAVKLSIARAIRLWSIRGLVLRWLLRQLNASVRDVDRPALRPLARPERFV